ncbi:KRE6 [[Candida] subhashii]|uniref:KRE6 n=1 Tax=[Candida] subhashii TaxID=561895 RepID=A0A8J5V132_9ASCO|nr:KRE6 [[Candida] subhashii]KAG7664099.1 KRE6 [[Candida] subhashii]
MSTRDLTSNTPQFNISANRNGHNGSKSDDIASDANSQDSHTLNHQNPFADQIQPPPRQPPTFVYSSSSSSASSSESSIPHLHNPQAHRFTEGTGYYSNGGSSNMLLETPDDHTRLMSASPAEYDRYPSLAGSRVQSSLSLASQLRFPFNNNGNNIPISVSQESTGASSVNSSSSSTPPPPIADLSPFGGYPASSFPLHIDEKEPDDYLHNPDPIEDAEYDKNRFMHDLKNMDRRSFTGMLALIILFLAGLMVFILVPALTYSGVTNHYHGVQVYEVLTRYEYPMLSAIRQELVDPDTPQEAMTWKSQNGDEWPLVFSDEFNAVGRTFYEGDDQFFTAPDLHYDATKDLEWYDPDAVTTANGTLNLRMDAFKNHNLFYRSGMVQSWNKFCFTQGKIEFSARLPNYGNVSGLWPGLWTMGNLGRPGYLASTEGVWPYSYESCDAGITPNQSSPDGISYLPGQRLNSCTCPGEDHPNPGVGRGAPEIDVLEAEMSSDPTGKKPNLGVASQSLQLAPFDIWYIPDYDFVAIHNDSVTTMNTYAGGPFQQALSGTTTLNHTWYEFGEDMPHNFQRYGFEYLNDPNKGYLTWFVGENPTLTVYSQALHPNGNIGWRPLSKEPMSLIMNLGISNNWAYIDWNSLVFPVTMSIDYVRVYQPADQINIGCDPSGFPTYNYIQSHLNVYENVNLTLFEDAGYKFPKNKLTGCK